MRYTFQLYLHYRENNSDVSLQVNELLRNWDDVQLAFKRNDYDGVVRSFTTSFDFVGEARAVVISQYLADGLRADVSVEYKALQENGTYSRLFICGLDFSTLQYDDYSAKISAVDASVEAIIKARKSTKFDLSVSDLSKNWLDYQGLPSTGYGVFLAKSRIEMTRTAVGSYYASLAMAFDYDKLPGYGESDALFAEDGTSVYFGSSLADLDGQAVFTTRNSTKVRVKMDITMRITDVDNAGISSVTVGFAKVSNVYPSISLQSRSVSVGSWVRVSLYVDSEALAETYSIVPYVRNGIGKSLLIEVQPTADNIFSVEYAARNGASHYFPVISAADIGTALVHKMFGTNQVLFTAETTNAWWRYTNVFSNGCINQGSGGVISTSWNDFTEWAKAVFGMVVEITSTNGLSWIKLVDRNNSGVFNTSSETEQVEFTEFELKVQNNLVYSEVNVGYDKQDISDKAAADDFCNGIMVFSTGIKNTEKVLNIKSPYRCSPWLIEQAVRDRDSQDTDAGDVFFVAATLKASSYFDNYDFALINRENYGAMAPSVGGCFFNDKIFNAMYNPRAMVLANTSLIAPCTASISYTSFDGNAKATVGGVYVVGNISGMSGIYRTDEITYETSDNTILSGWSGLFRITKQGMVYSGYLKDVSFSVAHPEKVKYVLILKEITENS